MGQYMERAWNSAQSKGCVSVGIMGIFVIYGSAIWCNFSGGQTGCVSKT